MSVDGILSTLAGISLPEKWKKGIAESLGFPMSDLELIVALDQGRFVQSVCSA
jgi:hypothetical protein